MITVCGRAATIACPHCSHTLMYIRTPTSHACRYCTYCGMPLAKTDDIAATEDTLNDLQNHIKKLERVFLEVASREEVVKPGWYVARQCGTPLTAPAREEVVKPGWYVIAGKDIAHYYRPSGRSRCGRLNIGRRKFSLRHSHATDFRPATDDDPRCSRCRMWIEHDNQTQET